MTKNQTFYDRKWEIYMQVYLNIVNPSNTSKTNIHTFCDPANADYTQGAAQRVQYKHRCCAHNYTEFALHGECPWHVIFGYWM